MIMRENQSSQAQSMWQRLGCWGFSGKKLYMWGGGGSALTPHPSRDRKQIVNATLMTVIRPIWHTATNFIFYSKFAVHNILQHYFGTKCHRWYMYFSSNLNKIYLSVFEWKSLLHAYILYKKCQEYAKIGPDRVCPVAKDMKVIPGAHKFILYLFSDFLYRQGVDFPSYYLRLHTCMDLIPYSLLSETRGSGSRVAENVKLKHFRPKMTSRPDKRGEFFPLKTCNWSVVT